MIEENNNFEQNAENKAAQTDNSFARPSKVYAFMSEGYLKKQEIRRTALALGIPLLCVSVIGYIWSSVYLFFTVQVAGMTKNQAIIFSQNPAVQQILQIILSCLMFLLPFSVAAKCTGARIDQLVKFENAKKGLFLPFLFFGIGFCSFSNIATSFASRIFEGFGIQYDVDFGENPSGIFGFLLTFISTAIVPALVEEFACRGIVLGLLKKHGKGFAIITSSILFGIMHGNFEQIPFAIMVGLILGYIYVKTGSIWVSVAVHGVNNAVSVCFNYLENVITVNMQNLLYLVYLAISMLAAIVGILLFAKNNNENYNLEKSKESITNKQKYTWFFTSWAIVLFIVLNFVESLSYFVV